MPPLFYRVPIGAHRWAKDKCARQKRKEHDDRMKISDMEKRLSGRPVGAIGGQKYHSVLLLLVDGQAGPEILFEQRSTRMKAQPGDVCLPGGRLEGEETAAQCALRETEEEIGLGATDIRLLGQFDTLYEINSITLYTFVGVVEPASLQKIRCNPAEVDHVFTVPLKFFRETRPKVFPAQIVQDVAGFPYAETGIRSDYRWRKGKHDIPIYRYEDHVIWGMTGRIVKWFVEEMEKAGEQETL